jgi:hypothetical protein
MAANRQRSTLNGTGIWRALASISVMALAFALPGCQGPVTGIFHHLAHQQPTVDRNLANDITIGGVARWDDRYVVAAGKLWSRPVGTTDKPGEWVPVTATYDGEQENAVLLPLVRWQPDRGDPMLLAGALFIDDDESFALLQADGNQVQANSIAWRTVGGDEVAGREVIGMFTPDEDESVLFVVVAYARGAERSYRLLSATGRSSGAPDFTVELPELSHPVEAVATDGAGTYWAVAGSELYTGTRGGLLLSDTAPSPEGSETFRGVVHGGTDTLLLTGSVGTVWRSPDGGRTWPDRHEIRVEDQAVRLAAVAAVSGTGLIGTDGYGYYTASFDGELAVERLPLTTEAIYQASILGFWVGPETADGSRTIRTLFVLTAGDGLWAATVATGELPDRWQLE